MSSKKKITIAGAGLVGSLLAILLARRGHEVAVHERRRDMRKAGTAGGRSINLAISDRGLKALRKAGLEAAIKKLCIPMRGRMMHSESGELVFQPYGREGQAINSISRGGLNLALIDFAEKKFGVGFHFNHQCVDLDFNGNKMIFEHGGRQASVAADLIFGADGAFSVVRGSMQKQDRFNYSQDYLPHAYKELCIPAGENGSWQIEKNALHIWPRKSFMLIALPNLDGSFTCTLFAPFEGENSFEKLNTGEEVKAFFKRFFPDALALMPALVEDFFSNPTSSLVTVKCYPWVNKNTALIGDAAHAIVPFYGQGMNAGFEDCTTLDEIIENGNDSWEDILHEYQQRRQENGNAIADLAKCNFIEMRDRVADPMFLLQKKIAKKVSEKFPARYLPVYSMVTFSHIPYSIALKEHERQEAAFEEILSWPNIREKWESDYFDRVVAKLEIRDKVVLGHIR